VATVPNRILRGDATLDTVPLVIPPEIATLIERLRPVLGRDPRIAAAWLFGSAARGELRADSDIDVGILLRDPKSTAADVYELLGELVARLEVVVAPRSVDLVLLEHQGPVFAHEALVDGRLILEQDRQRRIDFEATTVMRGIDFRPTWDLATAGQVDGLRRRLRGMR
jgi:predicted nucleotidyltransferase